VPTSRELQSSMRCARGDLNPFLVAGVMSTAAETSYDVHLGRATCEAYAAAVMIAAIKYLIPGATKFAESSLQQCRRLGVTNEDCADFSPG
jgi:hypothetical protein